MVRLSASSLGRTRQPSVRLDPPLWIRRRPLFPTELRTLCPCWWRDRSSPQFRTRQMDEEPEEGAEAAEEEASPTLGVEEERWRRGRRRCCCWSPELPSAGRRSVMGAM